MEGLRRFIDVRPLTRRSAVGGAPIALRSGRVTRSPDRWSGVRVGDRRSQSACGRSFLDSPLEGRPREVLGVPAPAGDAGRMATSDLDRPDPRSTPRAVGTGWPPGGPFRAHLPDPSKLAPVSLGNALP